MLAPTFDETQECGIFCQTQDQIVGRTTLYGTTGVGEITPPHLDRAPLQGCAHTLCHLLAERQQDRRKNERGVDLQLAYTSAERREAHPPVKRDDAFTWCQHLDWIEVAFLQFGDTLQQGRHTE